ncbi:MAG: VWA domain-containing protein [Planctomycetaceae bacterium]|nr:VWA domain-containing protein [Planctomycetaceae bacterium]
MRRLPIYLVLDTSESMVGEPIESVENGLVAMLGALRKDPYALETAYMSVISFGTTAKQLVPLTELTQFQMPRLVLGSGTSLGKGIDLLEQRIAAEVKKNTAEVKGDFKPIVFIFTDGEPTGSWQSAADRMMKNRHIQTVVVGTGQDINLDVLRRISELVILGKEANQETYAKFFKWVSASVATASQQIESTGSDMKISLDKLPVGDDIVVVDDSTPQQKIEPNRFVFMHNRCVKNKKFYLQKYLKSGSRSGGFFGGKKDAYIGDGAFALDDFEELGKGGGVTVNTGLLENPNPCPHCGNKIWGMCECGKTHCCPDVPQGGTITLTCPWCGKTATYGYSSFSVGGGGG